MTATVELWCIGNEGDASLPENALGSTQTWGAISRETAVFANHYGRLSLGTPTKDEGISQNTGRSTEPGDNATEKPQKNHSRSTPLCLRPIRLQPAPCHKPIHLTSPHCFRPIRSTFPPSFRPAHLTFPPCLKPIRLHPGLRPIRLPPAAISPPPLRPPLRPSLRPTPVLPCHIRILSAYYPRSRILSADYSNIARILDTYYARHGRYYLHIFCLLFCILLGPMRPSRCWQGLVAGLHIIYPERRALAWRT